MNTFTLTPEAAKARTELTVLCDGLIKKIEECLGSRTGMLELDRLRADVAARLHHIDPLGKTGEEIAELAFQVWQWTRVEQAVEESLASIGRANASDAFDQQHNYESLEKAINSYEQNVIDSVATKVQESIAMRGFDSKGKQLRPEGA